MASVVILPSSSYQESQKTIYHPTCLNLAKVDDRGKFLKHYEEQKYMCDNSNAEIRTTNVINYLYNNPITISCNEKLYLSDHIYKMKFNFKYTLFLDNKISDNPYLSIIRLQQPIMNTMK